MRVGTSYRQKDITGIYDAIVIGSGIGGLAVAALLARHADRRVLVLERHYTAGGFTHTFHRPGYEWDVGVHYVGQVTGPEAPLRGVFDDVTGGKLEWADMGDVYDTALIGDERFEFVKGAEAFTDRMKTYFPTEGAGIDRYVARLRSTVKKSSLFFTEKAIPQPLSRILGGLLRWPLLREARKTTREALAEIAENPLLAGVLTAQWSDYGLPPSPSTTSRARPIP